MQTNKEKKLITPDIPISDVSMTPADYGSTTTGEYSEHEKQQQQQQQSTAESRFTTKSERKSISPQNTGFGYHSLGADHPTRSPTLSTETRFPSFVNLPAGSGRFRIHQMDYNSKITNHRIKSLEQFLNILNHVLIGFVTIYMSWLCLRLKLAQTALHAWLVTIGFSFLMAEGIMCHYPGNVLTSSYQRDTKTTLHWVLQALGGSLGMIGALVKLIQKGFLLQTTHGQLGLAAFILCFFSMLSGLSALYSMRLKQLLSPLCNKTVHNYLGYITFVIAMFAQFYGYKTGFFKKKTENDFASLMKFLTILSLALTSIGPLKAISRKTFTIFNQYIK